MESIMALMLMTTITMCVLVTGDKLDLRMPQVQPEKKDTYLCYATKVDDPALYITAFEPHAKKQTAHHILLYGCEQPGNTAAQVWDCGEMASQSNVEKGPTCGGNGGGNIIYGWAMDAPSLQLPKDVAFKVGSNNKINYLVLQVHYKNVSKFLPPENKTDSSGITLTTTKTPLPKTAGIYLLGSSGTIPKNSVEYLETVCRFDERVTIHPITYRTHAHTLGRVISGYRIRDGEWTEIGRRDPQKPQMFYPTSSPGIEVKPGDLLAARCTFENQKDKDVEIGPTSSDEMCNFYIMYYVDGQELPNRKYCFKPGPPEFYWEDFAEADMNLEQLPETVSKTPNGRTWERTAGDDELTNSMSEREMDYLRYLLDMEEREAMAERDAQREYPYY